MKSPVLMVVHVDSYFSGFIDLARMLSHSGKLNPVFLFPRKYPNVQRHIGICRDEGLAFRSRISQPAGDEDQSRLTGLISSVRVRCAQLLGGLGRRLPAALRLPLTTFTLWRQYLRIAADLREDPPCLLVLGGDIVGHDMAMYIKAGHELGVPSVILPGWMASPREPAELNLHDPQCLVRGPVSRLFGALYPQWVFEHKGCRLLRLPLDQAAAIQLLGFAPPLPWILHSGDADLIAVESDAAREYGISLGLPASSFAVTGSRIHDMLAAGCRDMGRQRQILCRELGLNSDEPLVLCALPPDMMYGAGGRPECDFDTYEQLVEFWVSSLCAAAGGNVVVSLHPSADRTRVAFLEDYGARISDRHVAELIPFCDIYVACISATIQWAIAAAKPVVNYDVYRYRYTDYADVGGVLAVEEREQFVAVLGKLLGSKEFRDQVASRQAAEASRWGILDGCAGTRLESLFLGLIEKSAHPPTATEDPR